MVLVSESSVGSVALFVALVVVVVVVSETGSETGFDLVPLVVGGDAA